MLKRFLNELYQGTDYSFYLFWDGGPRAIGREKVARGKIESFTIHRLASKEDGDAVEALQAKLGELGYCGEPVEIILFGPAAIQSLWRMEDPNQEAAEWVIQNRDRILPAAISEDDLIFDFCGIELDGEKYLCTAFSRKSIIEALTTQGSLKDMVNIGGVRPLLALGIEKIGLGKLLENASDFPIRIPGTSSFLSDSNGDYHLVSHRENDSADHPAPECESPSVSSDGQAAGLWLYQTASDFLTQVHRYSIKRFNLILNVLLAAAILIIGTNLFLTAWENRQNEKLEELKFLKSDLERLNRDIKSLEKESQEIIRAEGLRSRLSMGMGAAAHFKPERLWWRKLEYKSGEKLIIEGFCVGQEEASGYCRRLLQSGYFSEVELGQLLKYEPAVDSPIPSKFHSDIYKFRLDISGI